MAIFAKTGDISSQSSAPAQHAVAVTPNDSTAVIFRSLWVGGNAGAAVDVAVEMLGGGVDVTFVAVPAGTLLPIAVSKVLSTGTGASPNIVGLS